MSRITFTEEEIGLICSIANRPNFKNPELSQKPVITKENYMHLTVVAFEEMATEVKDELSERGVEVLTDILAKFK